MNTAPDKQHIKTIHPKGIRRVLVRKFLFLDQNSLYYHQKSRKSAALLHFWLQFKQFCFSTKLRSTLKCEIACARKRQKPPITLSRIGGF